MDEGQFESLLDQVRELHRLADEVTREKVRFDAYVRARLSWDDRNAPPLPIPQRELADQVVEVLSKPLSPRSRGSFTERSSVRKDAETLPWRSIRVTSSASRSRSPTRSSAGRKLCRRAVLTEIEPGLWFGGAPEPRPRRGSTSS